LEIYLKVGQAFSTAAGFSAADLYPLAESRLESRLQAKKACPTPGVIPLHF
jgi:hypothetical protein